MKGHLMREDGYVNRSVGMIYISFQHHPTCMSGENARAGEFIFYIDSVKIISMGTASLWSIYLYYWINNLLSI